MNPLIKYILYLVSIALIAFIAIKPYNIYCNISGKCGKFSLVKFMPSNEGYGKVRVKFVTIDNESHIDLQAYQSELYTKPGRVNSIKYDMTNISTTIKNPVKFNIKYDVFPAEYKKYVKIYNCLCGKNYKLKNGKSKREEVVFKIKKEFEEEILYDEVDLLEIEIRYEVIPN